MYPYIHTHSAPALRASALADTGARFANHGTAGTVALAAAGIASSSRCASRNTRPACNGRSPCLEAPPRARLGSPVAHAHPPTPILRSSGLPMPLDMAPTFGVPILK